MSDEKYTRCPACATVFRVTARAARDARRTGSLRPMQGGVRRHRAAGVARRGDPTDRPPWRRTVAVGPADADRERGPTATGCRTRATRFAPADAVLRRGVRRGAGRRPFRASEHDVATGAHRVLRRVDRRAHCCWSPRRRRITSGIRSSRSGRSTRPPFEQFCAVAGCSIRPLRDAAMSHLSIEASDLQADPAHRGLLILTATLRNRATWPLAYPHLELTLTDAQDRVVVRRALAPADYAGGTADLQKGIAPTPRWRSRSSSTRARRRRPATGSTCSIRDGRSLRSGSLGSVPIWCARRRSSH